MKRSAIWVFALLFIPFLSQAQFKFGARVGLSTPSLDKETIDQSGLNLAIKEAKYGYHLGFFARASFTNTLYVQPEVLFNSNSVDFEISEFGELATNILSEKYQNLDLPVMVGAKLGPIRLEGGPVGHVFLNSKSDLDGTVDGYSQRFKDFTLGYQAGIGLDIGQRLLLDVRYEGNVNNFGDHMRIFNEEVTFSQNPSRIVATFGFSF